MADAAAVPTSLGGAIAAQSRLAGDEAKFSQEGAKKLEDIGQSQKALGEDFHKQLQDLKANAPKIPEFKPFQAPQQESPAKQFGSFAGLLATIASFESKTPLTTSLNAMAAGMRAVREGNAQAYNQAFKEWQINTEYAFKIADMENQRYMQNIELAKTDYQTAMSNLTTQATMLQDQAAMFTLRSQGIEGLGNLISKREELGLRAQEMLPKMVPYEIFHKSLEDFKHETGRDANAQEMAKFWGQAQMSGMYAMMDPAQMSSGAAQAATGQPLNQIAPGYGKEAAAMRSQLRAGAIQLIMQQQGVDATHAGQILAERTINYQAGKRSVTQLVTMRGATEQAIRQLDFNVDQTKKEMAKLGSSDVSPVVNAIARGVEKWTGNPAYSSLFYYMHASAVESARILSGGQASIAQLHQGAMEEAKQWANINMTPSMWDSVSDAMKAEGQQRLQTYDSAIDAQRQFTGGGDAGTGGFMPDPEWPPAPSADGKVLMDHGTVVARSKGGKWVQP
jgi:hypothetical protein